MTNKSSKQTSQSQILFLITFIVGLSMFQYTFSAIVAQNLNALIFFFIANAMVFPYTRRWIENSFNTSITQPAYFIAAIIIFVVGYLYYIL